MTVASTYNERTELLWRDIYSYGCVLFNGIFQAKEDERHLDPLNKVVLFYLQNNFLPGINKH